MNTITNVSPSARPVAFLLDERVHARALHAAMLRDAGYVVEDAREGRADIWASSVFSTSRFHAVGFNRA